MIWGLNTQESADIDGRLLFENILYNSLPGSGRG